MLKHFFSSFLVKIRTETDVLSVLEKCLRCRSWIPENLNYLCQHLQYIGTSGIVLEQFCLIGVGKDGRGRVLDGWWAKAPGLVLRKRLLLVRRRTTASDQRRNIGVDLANPWSSDSRRMGSPDSRGKSGFNPGFNPIKPVTLKLHYKLRFLS